MDPADKELLIVCRPQLVENINITGGLFTQLIARKVLNKRSVDTIRHNNPPDRQVEELLDLLPKRGPNAFKLFCEALIADDQENVVTSILEKREDLGASSAASTSSTSMTSTPSTSGPSVLKTVKTASESSASGACASDTTLSLSQKRKVGNSEDKEPEENDDTSTGASETDSCPAQKRVRPDSPSVICIKGNDKNVYKIYLPQTENKPSQSAPQNGADLTTFQPDELRYVLKHFISTDTPEEKRIDAHRELAASMLSDLPEQCLKLLSSSPKTYSKTAGKQEHLSHALLSLRERLTRCDSTDTMEQTPAQIQLEAPQQSDPDTSSVLHLTQSATIMSTVPRTRSVDLPDGPMYVRVERCTRQFYQSMKHKAYRMVGIPRGQALIINVNEVHDKPPRRGTDIDRDNLHNLLSQLHFNVTVYNDNDDLTAQGIVNKLRAFAAMHEHLTGDACILCLLSHGEEGYIFGTDGKRIPLDEIFLLFDNQRCPTLLNKPKIFFIQACRGGALDRGVKIVDETDGGPGPQSAASLVQHPSMSDMLICYPTLEGYYAWRNRERGSWYIEAVVQVFMQYAKSEDICAMLNRVNELVSRKVSRCPQVEMDRMSQMSEYKSSLRRPYLFFFPGIGSPYIDQC